eukprot:968501-Rhodomonas_salina.1
MGSALADSSTSTAFTCPAQAALCKGVFLSVSVALTEQPPASSARIVSGWLFSTAQRMGVRPALHLASRSKPLLSCTRITVSRSVTPSFAAR